MQSKNVKKSVIAHEIDWIMLIVTVALSVFGLFMIYSATRTLGTNSRVAVQSVAFALGCVMLGVMCIFDYEQFEGIIKPIFIACVAILILVLVLGTEGSWGGKSWIRLGGVSFQPAEFAKLGFILTFSYHLSRVSEKINKPLVVLGLLLHVAVLVGLILLQPDAGSAMVFLFMFILMLFAAKLSWKYIAAALGAGIVAAPLIYNFVLTPVQQNRIRIFLDPNLDPLGSGYNVIQSKVAVGSGMLYGKGFMQGTQNQMGYLPMKYTDFIFGVISEELGFIGAAIVTILLFVLIWRCFKAAQKADNLFGRYICVGVAAMLMFHTVENIGMCMGLTPVTGIPLPFISYGGTSLLTNMAAVGIVMSVQYHAKPKSIFDVY